MVVGAFPIAKLAVLLIKQISKPIANACKERAKSHPVFRKYVCMPPAQFYNWCELKAKMWILNLGKPVNIPVLSEQMAIELGANLLGEFVIFAIGSVLVLIEYTRQSYKEAAKEAKKEEEARHLRNTITELYFSVQQQQTQIKELERMIYTFAGKKPPDSPSTPTEKLTNDGFSPKNKSDVEIEIKSISHSIPYPGNGVILKSLNYIQMDVLSSSMFSKDDNSKPNNEPININSNGNKVVITNSKRESAVLSEALHSIENNFRSLF